MPLKADSAEFTALLDRWLNDAATAAEAELFWRCVRENPDCAAEFAAAARFEGLLTETVKARNVEAEARKVLAVSPRLASGREPATRRGSPGARIRPAEPMIPLRFFAIAAVLVVLGLVTAMLWPSDPSGTGTISKAAPHAPPPVKPVAALSAPPASSSPVSEPVPITPVAPGSMDPRQAGEPAFVEVPLTTRLDNFWLKGVSLDQVPLIQALAALRQLLVAADDKHTLPLDKLTVSVPPGASGRRVSFHSGAITYLKAVRAVAALAGCDVTVTDLSIALQIIPGTYPQVAETRQLADMLADRMSADGIPMIQNQARLNQLWSDAARLGISVNADGTAQISRGQWQALMMMTDAQDQLDENRPAFAIYLVPDGHIPQTGVLTPEQTQQLQENLVAQGIQPIAVVVPEINPPDNARPLIRSTVQGETVSYSASNAPGVQQTMPVASQDSPGAMVMAGRNVTLNEGIMGLMKSDPVMGQWLTSGIQNNGTVNFADTSNITIRGTIVIVPTTATATGSASIIQSSPP